MADLCESRSPILDRPCVRSPHGRMSHRSAAGTIWHDDEIEYHEPRYVTPAQQIRAWALSDAVSVVEQSDAMHSGGTAAAVVDLAEQFAAYIASGAQPVRVWFDEAKGSFDDDDLSLECQHLNSCDGCDGRSSPKGLRPCAHDCHAKDSS